MIERWKYKQIKPRCTSYKAVLNEMTAAWIIHSGCYDIKMPVDNSKRYFVLELTEKEQQTAFLAMPESIGHYNEGLWTYGEQAYVLHSFLKMAGAGRIVHNLLLNLLQANGYMQDVDCEIQQIGGEDYIPGDLLTG